MQNKKQASHSKRKEAEDMAVKKVGGGQCIQQSLFNPGNPSKQRSLEIGS